MVEAKVWVFLSLVGLIVLLLCLLWSAMRGREVHVGMGEIHGGLEKALPSLAGASHGTLLPGNKVELLQNGDGFFPSMLAAIAEGRETIDLETYVWWQGEICERVAEALARRAGKGVEVRVLLDSTGSSRMDDELLERMREAGVKVSKYRPPRISNLARVNSRDHRKILVVDGRVGFVFGHGIAEEWTGHAQDRDHWRDTGARLEGPIVGVLQSAFTDNWVEETGEVLAGDRFFPRLEPAGTITAHLAYHYQGGSVSAVDLLHRLVFAAAQRELWIQNPYLSPDADVLELLARAAERGVDVRLMLPGPNTDAQIVRHAGHRHFAELLRSGARIFEYQPTLNHQKVIVADGIWSHVGSTNLDNRSFESNDEVSLGIVDAGIAAQLRRAFLDDVARSKEITLRDWQREPWTHRLLDWFPVPLNDLY
jgi:cardiolipin synthase